MKKYSRLVLVAGAAAVIGLVAASLFLNNRAKIRVCEVCRNNPSFHPGITDPCAYQCAEVKNPPPFNFDQLNQQQNEKRD